MKTINTQSSATIRLAGSLADALRIIYWRWRAKWHSQNALMLDQAAKRSMSEAHAEAQQALRIQRRLRRLGY